MTSGERSVPRERTIQIDKKLWSTPQSFYDRLNLIYNFTLDVCAESRTAKCENYFTEEDDALKQDWGENICWGNFPYGNPEFPCKSKCVKKRCVEREHHIDAYIPGIKDWVEKAWLSSLNGATVVGLLPVATDTRWFHDFVFQANILIFIDGRIKFEYNNKVMGTPDFGSMIAIWEPLEKLKASPANHFPSMITMKAYLDK